MKEFFEATIPIRIVSEANAREHWAKRHARHKKHKEDINLYVRGVENCSPCHVILTRIAPRELDYVNLVSSLKNAQDIIADKIKPGLAPGRADGDKSITWDFNQKKSGPKFYALKVEIQKKGENHDNNST